MRRSQSLLLLFACAGLVSIALSAQEVPAAAPAKPGAVIDQLYRPAVQSAIAEHAVMLDVTRVGNRLVAVGERGMIVYTDDGRKWTQAKVPTSISLTAVRFVNGTSGWAVGHGCVVLRTTDAGATWVRQLDGRQVPKLAQEAAQAFAAKPGVNKKEADLLTTEAQRLESDGPDKPFLDIYFENENVGYVVGAYGLVFRTEDAGKTWKAWMDHVDNPRGLHIYAIGSDGKAIYMAGEQGLVLRSTDNGNKFTRVQTPYNGTYFTMVALKSGEVILGGMRGNMYRSTDQGKTFKQIPVPIPVSFAASTLLGNGTILFANQAGQLLASEDKGQTIHPLPINGLPPISGIVEGANNMIITAGFAGVIPVPMNGAPTPSAGGAK